jgi:septal ring factor EnvC (AmiA/AmiB activator)
MRIPFLRKNTLECRLKAARAELEAFKIGKKYQDMQETHRKEVRALECRNRQLEEELAQAHRDLKANTRHWFEVFGDLNREYRKKTAALMKRLAQMERRALHAERERDECKDKMTQQRRRSYEVETALEEEKGKNSWLKAQLGQDHETSSIPLSKGIRRKKITNSREKTGKKPGGSRAMKGTAGKDRSLPSRRSS